MADMPSSPPQFSHPTRTPSLMERFTRPFYLFNTLLCVAYGMLRVYWLSPVRSAETEIFGVTREAQIYLFTCAMLFTRASSAASVDAFVASVVSYARVAVLACLWHMDRRVLLLFLVVWLALHILCPLPRPGSALLTSSLSSSTRECAPIDTLTAASFAQRVYRNPQRVIYVVWCHAPWSARCAQLAHMLSGLAGTFAHPGVKFARLDVAKFAESARVLGVSNAARSDQLPCVICFRQGVEVARFPAMDGSGCVAEEWARGFQAADVARALDLGAQLRTASVWEAEAHASSPGREMPRAHSNKKKAAARQYDQGRVTSSR